MSFGREDAAKAHTKRTHKCHKSQMLITSDHVQPHNNTTRFNKISLDSLYTINGIKQFHYLNVVSTNSIWYNHKILWINFIYKETSNCIVVSSIQFSCLNTIVQPPVWVILFIYKLVNHCMSLRWLSSEVWCYLINRMVALKLCENFAHFSIITSNIIRMVYLITSFHFNIYKFSESITLFGSVVPLFNAMPGGWCYVLVVLVEYFPSLSLYDWVVLRFTAINKEFHLKMANISNLINHFISWTNAIRFWCCINCLLPWTIIYCLVCYWT